MLHTAEMLAPGSSPSAFFHGAVRARIIPYPSQFHRNIHGLWIFCIRMQIFMRRFPAFQHDKKVGVVIFKVLAPHVVVRYERAFKS